ncbi:hypothetical protein BSZ05_26615 (plasmid) [Vibrio mediterranei]|uniref:Uncharacterized protein n=1 Tax=Vibrio mediterranei TaxID=689 RepID=A0AAN1FMH4_9VIBR|nr:hypothetical protein BSZ05_26615 [Vibrio mediterranei]
MRLLSLQYRVLKMAQRLRLLPPNLPIDKLHSPISIRHRLDEYREMLEDIENQTQFFSNGPHWSKNHALTLDDFLGQLEALSTTPHSTRHLRPQPSFLSKR